MSPTMVVKFQQGLYDFVGITTYVCVSDFYNDFDLSGK